MSEAASPICRGKNLTLETVLSFVNAMPKSPLPTKDFNSYAEARLKGWTQTHSQIARQLAFYYEENGICYPRFNGPICKEELFSYMEKWAKKYFVPNPYTPSLFEYDPKNIYASIRNAYNNGIVKFDDACNQLLGIELNNIDKVRVYLTTFTNLVIELNTISINNGITDEEIPDENPVIESWKDPKTYFEYFNDNLSSIKTNSQNKTKYAFQQIFYGAPGTGKSHKVKVELSEISKKNIFRTTFHPDSDYSTFVGAYKPTMKRNYKYEGKVKATYYEDDDLAGAKKGDKVIEEKIEYRFIPQAFMKAYIQAYKHHEEDIYLIIEEINRGNCAQIFGDLFQLLDRDEEGKSEYPIKADSDILSFLEQELGSDNKGIQDGELCLPSNLFIWATMNTSDQSLFPIDSAFKRRWEWEYMPIKYDRADVNILIGDEKFSWVKFQKAVNEKILSDTSSEDKMLGDYFVNPSNKIITKDILVNKIFFYLWNDVCKDGDSDIFRISETEELSFSELYTNEAKLIALMHKLTDDKEIASQETTQDE